jgi:hypothetical protein
MVGVLRLFTRLAPHPSFTDEGLQARQTALGLSYMKSYRNASEYG